MTLEELVKQEGAKIIDLEGEEIIVGSSRWHEVKHTEIND